MVEMNVKGYNKAKYQSAEQEQLYKAAEEGMNIFKQKYDFFNTLFEANPQAEQDMLNTLVISMGKLDIRPSDTQEDILKKLSPYMQQAGDSLFNKYILQYYKNIPSKTLYVFEKNNLKRLELLQKEDKNCIPKVKNIAASEVLFQTQKEMSALIKAAIDTPFIEKRPERQITIIIEAAAEKVVNQYIKIGKNPDVNDLLSVLEGSSRLPADRQCQIIIDYKKAIFSLPEKEATDYLRYYRE
jgi:hypothetical protein